MSELLLNGAPVLSATISLPQAGPWTAELVADTEQNVTGDVVLADPEEAFALQGTVRSGGAPHGRWAGRIAAGADGLGTVLPARYYHDVPVRLVLADLARETGETLSADIAPELLNLTLPKWTREAGTALRTLRALAESLGATWRHLLDGKLYLTRAEAWLEVRVPHVLMHEDPAGGGVTIATDTLAPELVPGVTFVYGGAEEKRGRVVAVEHRVAERELRTVLTFEGGGTTIAGLRELVRRTVLEITRRFRFYGSFPAQVVQQAADGTLELVPDGLADRPETSDVPRMPAMTKVPIRPFVPGATVKVSGGARGRVTFEGGSPTRPVLADWEKDTAKLAELRIDATVKQTLEAPLIHLGGNATKSFMLTESYNSALNTYLTAEAALETAMSVFLGTLTTYTAAIQPVADPPGVATTTFQTAITTLTTAITTFISAVSTFQGLQSTWLSSKVKGE